MAKQKNQDPHRMQAIAWRDGQKKEIVVKCLNHPAVLAAMDETAKQNTGEMVLWGARKLRELGMAGKLNINEPALFSNKPEEVKELESRIQKLESALYLCQTAVKTAAIKVRQPGYNATSVIDECLHSVVSYGPTFMGQPVDEPEDNERG